LSKLKTIIQIISKKAYFYAFLFFDMAEPYNGVKFNYKNIGKTISEHPLLYELKYWCAVFNHKNLAPPYPGGSSGNLSFRLNSKENNFIITASRTALNDSMVNTDFSEVINYYKNQNLITGKGEKEPSSESIMHFLIYKNRNDINAIFHGHSPEILKHAEQLNIPTTEKELPYGTVEFAKNALNLLHNSDFIILKNHGFVSLGNTMQDAGEQTYFFLNKCKSFK